eukprot:TRINITY_DN523_c2_g2_i1.p1 TRINITY_DN523_c2_g2~~TRINITY_DN523_c2_g2_i1.p1  ORF type:complete len:542 (+),score=170.08 TRINITY_DN523_c2_g2_i1:198-1823(+)
MDVVKTPKVFCSNGDKKSLKARIRVRFERAVRNHKALKPLLTPLTIPGFTPIGGKPATESLNPFDFVPIDILREIFLNLEYASDLGAVAMVCKLWDQVSSTDEIWEDITKAIVPASKKIFDSAVSSGESATWKTVYLKTLPFCTPNCLCRKCGRTATKFHPEGGYVVCQCTSLAHIAEIATWQLTNKNINITVDDLRENGFFPIYSKKYVSVSINGGYTAHDYFWRQSDVNATVTTNRKKHLEEAIERRGLSLDCLQHPYLSKFLTIKTQKETPGKRVSLFIQKYLKGWEKNKNRSFRTGTDLGSDDGGDDDEKISKKKKKKKDTKGGKKKKKVVEESSDDEEMSDEDAIEERLAAKKMKKKEEKEKKKKTKTKTTTTTKAVVSKSKPRKEESEEEDEEEVESPKKQNKKGSKKKVQKKVPKKPTRKNDSDDERDYDDREKPKTDRKLRRDESDDDEGSVDDKPRSQDVNENGDEMSDPETNIVSSKRKRKRPTRYRDSNDEEEEEDEGSEYSGDHGNSEDMHIEEVDDEDFKPKPKKRRT